MIKNILAESRRAMNVGVFLGVIGVILSICFDSWNDLVRAFVNQNGCVHYFFWNSAYGGVCRTYLLPVFAAVPYAAGFCADKNNHVLSFVLVREGKKGYGASKYIVNAFFGGMTVAIGTGILFYSLAIFFPVAEEYSAEEITPTLHFLIASTHPYLYGLVEVGNAFLRGMLWSSLAIFVSLFIQDSLVVIISPYFLSFVLVQVYRIFGIPGEYRLDFLLTGRVVIKSSVYTLGICTIVVFAIVGLFGILFVKKIQRGVENGLYS